MVVATETLAEEIPKTLVYFATPELCAQFVRDLRMCLPDHLQTTVWHFSVGVSNKAKEQMWELYREGAIWILVSTEAMALGCNEKHIKFCFVFLAGMDPRSLSVRVLGTGERENKVARDKSGHTAL